MTIVFFMKMSVMDKVDVIIVVYLGMTTGQTVAVTMVSVDFMIH
ncbi:hypothetical protein [Marinithermofilum abyssi]|nr:hypothetical protein [Marinithermofilum abyssi]